MLGSNRRRDCCTSRSGNGRSTGGCIAWALFMGLFIVLAQLAPVVLFPIFYKFEPLDNEDLRRSPGYAQRARGNPRARRLSLETFGEEQESERGSHRTRSDPPNHSRRHAARQLHAGRNRSGAGARTRPPRAPPHSEKHFRAGGDHAARFLGGELGAALRGRSAHVRRTLGLRQPAVAGAGFRRTFVSVDAGAERVFPLQRAPGRPLRASGGSKFSATLPGSG